MFSPYYASARRRGPADPENHLALNVALYRRRGGAWCMTERGREAGRRSATRFEIGPSAMHWNGSTLTIDVDEVSVPWPRRMRGRISVHAPAMLRHPVALDAAGRHRWRPLAPVARAEVEFSNPRVSWSGHAYVDSNDGDEPLERAFRGWHWSRVPLGDGRGAVFYDVEASDGRKTVHAFSFEQGVVRTMPPPGARPLPRSGWGLERRTLGDAPPRLVRSLEDAPFYARALVETTCAGVTAVAVHETLSLERFRRRPVQWMLPFRMPRWARR